MGYDFGNAFGREQDRYKYQGGFPFSPLLTTGNLSQYLSPLLFPLVFSFFPSCFFFLPFSSRNDFHPVLLYSEGSIQVQ